MMNTSQRLKAYLLDAQAQVDLHRKELVRRCRELANDGDAGLAYTLANLDAAEKTVTDLSGGLATPKNGQPASKRPNKRRKSKAKPKRKGPTLTAAQDAAIAAVPDGGEMRIRDLFEWCQAKHPGVFEETQMGGFASTFSKKVNSRDDIEVVRKHKGARPAVYMKMGATVPP